MVRNINGTTENNDQGGSNNSNDTTSFTTNRNKRQRRRRHVFLLMVTVAVGSILLHGFFQDQKNLTSSSGKSAQTKYSSSWSPPPALNSAEPAKMKKKKENAQLMQQQEESATKKKTLIKWNNNNNNKSYNISSGTKDLLLRRLQPLNLKDGKFSFVHISKCAGASWIQELRDIIPNFVPRKEFGPEHSVAYQKLHYYPGVPPNEHMLLTSFKHPRAHVWSLWGECNFDKIWKKYHEVIPYDNDATYDVNFNHWLNHFLTDPTINVSSALGSSDYYNLNHIIIQSENGDGDDDHDDNIRLPLQIQNSIFRSHYYNCYHPSNYQTRPFVTSSKISDPHGVPLVVNNPKKQKLYLYEPAMEIVRNIRDNDFVWISISEFFHESKCLLYYRLLSSINVTTTTPESFPESKNQSRTNETTKRNSHRSLRRRRRRRIQQKQQLAGPNQPVPTQEEKERRWKKASVDIPTYLETYCRCPTVQGLRNSTVHVKHFQEGKRKTMTNLDAGITKKLDMFTRIDTINYKESLIQFIFEIALLEKRLGRRVMCDTTLLKWELELDYVGLPDTLTNMYQWATEYMATNTDL